MASISITGVGTNSVSMRLVSLDTAWSGGVRYPYYYIKTGGYPTEYNYQFYRRGNNIYNNASYGGETSVSGLASGTFYYVTCYVEYSGGLLATLYATFRTNAEVVYPSISSFSVTQNSVGYKTAYCSWSGSNIAYGSSYTIYVNGWLKQSGTTSNSGGVSITLDYFQSYTATLTITSNGVSTSKSATFSITGPYLSSFSATAVSGEFKANCRWSVVGGSSKVTLELRTSTSYPNYPQTDGFSKGTFSYSTTSTTISLENTGNIYIWINIFYDGEYLGYRNTNVTISIQKPSSWNWTSAEKNAFNNKDWWNPTNGFDRPATNADSDGFIYGLDPEFVKIVTAATRASNLNSVAITDDSTNHYDKDDNGVTATASRIGVRVTHDKFTLASFTEYYMDTCPVKIAGTEKAIRFGVPFEYYSRLNPSPTTSALAGRIKYYTGSARFWFGRSAIPGNTNSVYFVNTDGSINNYYAFNAFGCAPACSII